MTTVIKCCRGEKKRAKRKINGFRKKLMITEPEISEVQSTTLNPK